MKLPMSKRVNNPSLPDEFSDQLNSLRRGIRWWYIADGIRHLVVLLAGLALVSFGLDYWLRMDKAQRAVYLALALGGVVTLTVRRILQPLSRPLSDDDLSLAAEARKPELKQRLISSLQLRRLGKAGEGTRGFSPELIAATLAQGRTTVAATDLTEVINRKQQRRNLFLSGALITLFLLSALAAPNIFGLWLKRNLLLSNENWPRYTQLLIAGVDETNTLYLPTGDDLEVRVTVKPGSVLPTMVFLETRTVTGQYTEPEQMPATEKMFRRQFKNVLEPFSFRVHGGDDQTAWVRVKLRLRPKIATLKVSVTPPAYTKIPTQSYPGTQGVYRLRHGSRVTLTGTSNKPLARVELRLKKQTLLSLPLKNQCDFVLPLAAEKVRDGVYSLRLTDAEGLSNKRPPRLTLRIQPDTKPRVTARSEGIGEMILNRAVVPIRITIRDDYAIDAARIIWQTTSEDGTLQKEGGLPLTNFAKYRGRAKITRLEKMAVGAFALQPGMRLNYRVEAKDNDPLPGAKTGLSSPLSLRVVSEAEMRAYLFRREQELRRQFDRLLKDQRQLLDNTRILEAVLQKKPNLSASTWDGVTRTRKKQRLLGQRLSRLAELFAQILAEVQNNRLELTGSAMATRLRDRIVNPLRRLAVGGVTEAADSLGQVLAHRKDDSSQIQLEATKIARKRQIAILAELRVIRKYLVKSASFQQAVNTLREILEREEKLKHDTSKAQQKELEDLFE